VLPDSYVDAENKDYGGKIVVLSVFLMSMAHFVLPINRSVIHNLASMIYMVPN
jgi:hypothetical protein